MSPVLVAAILLAAAVALSVPHAEGAESYKGKGVAVVISKSCQISPSCITYADLVPLDNSNQEYSGKFVTKDGRTYRESSPYQNNYRFYQYSNTFTVFVDPPSRVERYFPTIEIVPHLREYHLPTQMDVLEYKVSSDAKATKQVRSYSHTRYVDATCTNAVITAENWKVLLPDTIFYLQSKCDPKATNFKTVSLEMKDLTVHDITTSAKWKHDKWLEQVREKCISARNSCSVQPPANS